MQLLIGLGSFFGREGKGFLFSLSLARFIHLSERSGQSSSVHMYPRRDILAGVIIRARSYPIAATTTRRRPHTNKAAYIDTAQRAPTLSLVILIPPPVGHLVRAIDDMTKCNGEKNENTHVQNEAKICARV